MVEIKICGLRDADMARRIVSLGIRHVGIVFMVPESPRNVDEHVVTDIMKSIKGKAFVALVTRLLDNAFIDHAMILQPSHVQVHEFMDKLVLKRLMNEFQGNVIFGVNTKPSQLEFDLIRKFMREKDIVLIDGSLGKGIPAHVEDLDACMKMLQSITDCKRNQIFIAGGLTPDTAGPVIRKLRPGGIDVSSGVESSPGVKDIEKITRLIEIVNKINKEHR